MFNFDVRCVSRKFTTYPRSPPIQKMITDVVYLSERLAGTVRFLTTVDVMLEEYNSCLPNNKWLGVKQVSIVLGWPLLLNRGFFLTYPENIVYDDILWIQRLYFLKFNLGGAKDTRSETKKTQELRLIAFEDTSLFRMKVSF